MHGRKEWLNCLKLCCDSWIKFVFFLHFEILEDNKLCTIPFLFKREKIQYVENIYLELCYFKLGLFWLHCLFDKNRWIQQGCFISQINAKFWSFGKFQNSLSCRCPDKHTLQNLKIIKRWKATGKIFDEINQVHELYYSNKNQVFTT